MFWRLNCSAFNCNGPCFLRLHARVPLTKLRTFLSVLLNTTLILLLSVSTPPHRMTHGACSTPMLYSKPWATCCVLGTAHRLLRGWLMCGSPCSVWSLAPPATPCLLATPLLSYSHWTPHDGSIKRRWSMAVIHLTCLNNLIIFISRSAAIFQLQVVWFNLISPLQKEFKVFFTLIWFI